MSAGSFAAGTAPAGAEPPPTFSIPPPPPVAQAYAVDGTTLDYVVEPTGRYLNVHWVDAAVFDTLRMAIGSITSAPAAGSRVRQIRYIDKALVTTQVVNRVNLDLADLLARTLITIESLTVDVSVANRIQYLFVYINNVTAKRNKFSG